MVLMVTAVTNLDVSNGTVSLALPGAAPNITVSISGSNYVINDPNDSIVLDANAVSANWSNFNANTVMGPISGISNISITTAAGTGIISGIAAGSANLSLSGPGTITVNARVVTTSGKSWPFPRIRPSILRATLRQRGPSRSPA